ncbi:MAG TPA: hypothetical protein VGG64_13145 [Pirellulales bacterium]|jgi:hypothetical protein
MSKPFILAIALASLFWTLPAAASTTTDDFTFSDGSTVIATGFFSYDSSLSGTLNYADLSAFSITIAGQTYNLAFANGGVPGSDYDSFSYNTVTNAFDPTIVNGAEGTFETILAATQINGSLTSGFFFDPLPSQSDPLGNGYNDGLYSAYATGPADATFTSFAITPTPLPSGWIMMLSALAGLGFLGCRRQKLRMASSAA